MMRVNSADYLTTGQVAKLYKLSQQTVIRFCDTGILKHFSIPRTTGKPGRGHRRIHREDARAFAEHNFLPFGEPPCPPCPKTTSTAGAEPSSPEGSAASAPSSEESLGFSATSAPPSIASDND